jgi:hypothetical protein
VLSALGYRAVLLGILLAVAGYQIATRQS